MIGDCVFEAPARLPRKPGVVVDADARQQGNLLATQARDSPVAPTRVARLAGDDPGAAQGQDLPDLAAVARALTLRPPSSDEAALQVPG